MTPVDALLAVFSEDLAVARHFVATRPPSRNASGIDYPSKKLSKMAGYSASYSFSSLCMGRV